MPTSRDDLQLSGPTCYRCLWREQHLFHDDGTPTGWVPETALTRGADSNEPQKNDCPANYGLKRGNNADQNS